VLRYLNAWHILGLPRQDLRELVTDSLANYGDLRKSSPLEPLDTVKADSALFVHGLMYWPFIRQFKNLPIAGENDKQTNPQLVDLIMQWYDDQRWKDLTGRIPCVYAVVSEPYWRKANSINSFDLVFQNECRRIYRIPAESGY
jgi:hypothetical protein